MNTKVKVEEAESAYIVRLERGRQSESDGVEYLYLTPRDAGSNAPRDSSRAADPKPPLPESKVLPPLVTAAPPSSRPSGSPSSKPQYEGFMVSHYQVERAIGRGGMGDVYLARDLRLGRPVALKLLRADYQPTEERVHRFQQEARAVCALNHPNIVTVYEVGEVDGAPFIVSEFIEGDTLRQLIPPSGMRLDQALEIAIQIANALAFAHQLGIVHRDIKPENVMVRSDGYVKVLDFGLAKLSDALDDRDHSVSSATGVVMGTITYMSPEQARGYKLDARTDVFSLGATLYELVTGAKPFTGRNPTEILSAILTREPAPVASYKPDESPGIQSTLTRALRKDRNERYATMTEMIRDLRELKNEIAFQSLRGRDSSPLASPAAESQIILLPRAGDDLGAISSNTSWPDHLSGKQIGARITAEVDAAPAPLPAPRPTNDPIMLLAQEPAKAAANVVMQEPVREAANPAAGTSRDTTLKQPLRYWPAAMPTASRMRRRPNHRKRHAAIALAAASALLIVAFLVLPSLFRRQPVSYDQVRFTSTGQIGNAVISPDGRFVAYSQAEAGGKQRLWLRQVEAPSATAVVPPRDVIYLDLTFSRDGAYLYYLSAETKSSSSPALYRMAMLGGPLQKLAVSPAESFCLAADGQRVAYTRNEEGGGRSLVVADLNTGQERKVTLRKKPNTFLVKGLAWSPDDEWIACAMASTDAEGRPSESLIAINVKVGQERPLSPQSWRSIGKVIWLRESEGLILAGNTGADRLDQLWHVPGAGELRRVTNDANHYTGLSLTADGRTIATVQVEDPHGTRVSDAVLINRVN